METKIEMEVPAEDLLHVVEVLAWVGGLIFLKQNKLI